ncbi:hypothetical protein PPACK8108_LOCUS24354 [Phakopsora pachyrhizi]|uniref:rRNA biogenesis protein RRP36 n=1 Tax=Phakopsora pachyrhizi TaxID=170000 RepID=A0AAV0BPK5_PHAPC|nr:hypothetical protein PPACK8108_LOCUS24354 [Phakopsora pachyrhizi]
MSKVTCSSMIEEIRSKDEKPRNRSFETASVKEKEEEEEEEEEEETFDDGSLEGESEDEWAEERRSMRYIAESELELEGSSNASSDSDDSVEFSQVSHKGRKIGLRSLESIGSILKHRSSSNYQNKDFKRTPGTGLEESGDNPESDLDSHHSEGFSSSSSVPEDEQSAKKASSSSIQKKSKNVPSRSNKHAPIERSSKRPVTRRRTVVEAPKVERRDPRFDSLSGGINEELVERSYSFLRSQRKDEIEKLRELVKRKRNRSGKSQELEELRERLRRMENLEVQQEKIQREKEALKRWNSEERQRQKQGKAPYYLKKKKQKEVILADRIESLSKDKRRLKKSMDRKLKKISAKDKKSIPRKRIQREH